MMFEDESEAAPFEARARESSVTDSTASPAPDQLVQRVLRDGGVAGVEALKLFRR